MLVTCGLTFWLVTARPRRERLAELKRRLDSGEISKMSPFGGSLHYGLKEARVRSEDGYAVWEEEDYCRPPLSQEREAVLDDYFDDLSVVDIGEEGTGWEKIEKLPSLWKRNPSEIRR